MLNRGGRESTRPSEDPPRHRRRAGRLRRGDRRAADGSAREGDRHRRGALSAGEAVRWRSDRRRAPGARSGRVAAAGATCGRDARSAARRWKGAAGRAAATGSGGAARRLRRGPRRAGPRGRSGRGGGRAARRSPRGNCADGRGRDLLRCARLRGRRGRSLAASSRVACGPACAAAGGGLGWPRAGRSRLRPRCWDRRLRLALSVRGRRRRRGELRDLLHFSGSRARAGARALGHARTAARRALGLVHSPGGAGWSGRRRAGAPRRGSARRRSARRGRDPVRTLVGADRGAALGKSTEARRSAPSTVLRDPAEQERRMDPQIVRGAPRRIAFRNHARAPRAPRAARARRRRAVATHRVGSAGGGGARGARLR